MICACTETSSAEVGSSSSSARGCGCQRAGDADALLLPAGQFVRVAPQEFARPARHRAAARRHARAARSGRSRRSGATARRPSANTVRRGIQRGVRVLEHHLHRPAQFAQRALRRVRDVGAVEQDPARRRVAPGAAASAAASSCRNRIRRPGRALRPGAARGPRRRPRDGRRSADDVAVSSSAVMRPRRGRRCDGRRRCRRGASVRQIGIACGQRG